MYGMGMWSNIQHVKDYIKHFSKKYANVWRFVVVIAPKFCRIISLLLQYSCDYPVAI